MPNEEERGMKERRLDHLSQRESSLTRYRRTVEEFCKEWIKCLTIRVKELPKRVTEGSSTDSDYPYHSKSRLPRPNVCWLTRSICQPHHLRLIQAPQGRRRRRPIARNERPSHLRLVSYCFLGIPSSQRRTRAIIHGGTARRPQRSRGR